VHPPRAQALHRRLLALALGTVATLGLLELSLVVAHRGFLAWQTRATQAPQPDGSTPVVHILAIGESTTAVAGNASNTLLVPGTSWPVQLEAVLNARQDQVRFRVDNAAVMGGNSAAALDLMHDALGRTQPDLIIAMMGIMDTPGDTRTARASVPGWLSWLRTAQLAAWLVETVRIKESRAVAEARTVADLPRSGRDGSLMPVGRGSYELRMKDHPGAQEQVVLADYLAHTGFFDRSEAILRELVSTQDLGHAALAHLLLGLDRPEDALTAIDHAIAAHPEEGLYRVVRAGIERHRGHHASALATLDDAVTHLDDYLEPHIVADFIALERSAVHLAMGDADAAIAVAEAVRGGGESAYKGIVPNIFLRREKAIGRAYIAKSDWASAERHLLAALELQPDRALNLMWTLTEVYRSSGQADKEAALREELLARTGRVGEYLELARLMRNQGDAETAARVEADAARQTPSLRQAYDHLYRSAHMAGAQVVVVQYPMFPLDSVQRWAPPAPGVHHVDTEHVFDGVVETAYADAGLPAAFSHYSKDGARLLAESIADTVLSVYVLDHAPEGQPSRP